MQVKFIIELDEETLVPCYDNNTIIDLINFYNWNDNQIEVYYGFKFRDRIYKSIRDAAIDRRINLTSSEYLEFVPVGSIPFINDILHRLNKPSIKAINIPEQLRGKEFTSRYVGVHTREELGKLVDNKELFIKSAEFAKQYTPQIISDIKETYSLEPGKYFVSDVIDLKAEWRVFVHNNTVIDCREYYGLSRYGIDLDFVYKCMKAYTNSPKSYTLDIGLTFDNKYVVLEVHNFISCGLYGSDSDKLIPMLVDGWKHELYGGDGIEKES